jgi:hypothetical protein
MWDPMSWPKTAICFIIQMVINRNNNCAGANFEIPNFYDYMTLVLYSSSLAGTRSACLARRQLSSLTIPPKHIVLCKKQLIFNYIIGILYLREFIFYHNCYLIWVWDDRLNVLIY